MKDKIGVEEIIPAKEKLQKLVSELKKEITGQRDVIQHILICLISKGHVLLEGMPGLAKTLLAKTFSRTIDLSFRRIQFTPDLLPADLIGTVVYNPKKTNFEIRKGPIFTGVLLADEINRAPAKVQSALLQCMEERLVTIGDTTFELDAPFIVIATENPIDQEGTYQLPEAQMDRFLMKINVDYPSHEEEVAILGQHGKAIQGETSIEKVITGKEVLDISSLCDKIYVDPKLEDYIVRIVRNTRPATTEITSIKSYLKHGASPRASLSLLRAARAKALLEGRNFTLPEDIKYSFNEILRHRVILTFEALSEDVSIESILQTIQDSTPLP
jgi:MoxR-like ATPase